MGRIIGVLSSRPDGATALSAGLAAVLSADRRSLLIDLNLERPELAPLLDLDETQNLFHLAYSAQLVPVSAQDLEEHLRWRDGTAVLGGISHPAQRDRVSDPFLDSLLATARGSFEQVTLDLGRARSNLPRAAVADVLLWAVTPSPLGLAAFDKSYRALEDRGTEWLESAAVVLTRSADDSMTGVDRFLERSYGARVVGSLPYAPAYWRRVEYSHSLRALVVPLSDRERYLRAYGAEALTAREALRKLAETVLSAEPVRA